ncbi:MAG: beta-lactamase family protein, partial [Rhodospirillaceae bacterium]|nr:beta-lactamase family protein [Rhodospirillaceae bacterium]
AALVDQGKRAGVVYAVARGGKLAALKALGWRNLENKVAMTTDSIFRIYSMSRAVTGSAVLTLVEDGKLSLDDPVAKYIPEIGEMPVITEVLNGQVIATVPQAQPMTIRHLFNYTSGLGYAPAWPAGVGIKQRDILALDQTTIEGIRKLAKYPLLHQPGTKWAYGFHSDVLGAVAEVISGQPLDRFVRERVTGKLGMADTDFTIAAASQPRFADVYRPGPDGKLRNISAEAPPSGNYLKPGPFFSGGGGMTSTAMDFLSFAEMLRQGGSFNGARVLKPETVKAMTTNALTARQGGEVYWNDSYALDLCRGYGWGLALGVRLPPSDTITPHTAPGTTGDFGWYSLANAMWFADPSEEISAVVMSHYQGVGQRDAGAALREGVYAALGRV